MTKNHYLRFKDKECPHCNGRINIDVFYDVVDRFQVDYEARLEKMEDSDTRHDEKKIIERLETD